MCSSPERASPPAGVLWGADLVGRGCDEISPPCLSYTCARALARDTAAASRHYRQTSPGEVSERSPGGLRRAASRHSAPPHVTARRVQRKAQKQKPTIIGLTQVRGARCVTNAHARPHTHTLLSLCDRLPWRDATGHTNSGRRPSRTSGATAAVYRIHSADTCRRIPIIYLYRAVYALQ